MTERLYLLANAKITLINKKGFNNSINFDESVSMIKIYFCNNKLRPMRPKMGKKC